MTPHLQVGSRSFGVFQVYYDQASRQQLDPLFIPYYHPRLDAAFESSVIAALLAEGRHREADYFGVFSWRFAAKIPIGTPRLLARLAHDDGAADAYAFFGRVRDRHIWATANQKHPGILAAASVLLTRLGLRLRLDTLEAPVVYQNHVVCRSPHYERFGREILQPALAAMANRDDAELQTLLQVDAHYTDPRFSDARLREVFGQPHFTLVPFIAERLFSTWLGITPEVRLRHIWHGRFVEAHNVVHEPEMREAVCGE